MSRQEFYAPFRGYLISILREDEGANWYIRVQAPNGCYVYDGYWRESAGKTKDEAIEEALHGSGLRLRRWRGAETA